MSKKIKKAERDAVLDDILEEYNIHPSDLKKAVFEFAELFIDVYKEFKSRTKPKRKKAQRKTLRSRLAEHLGNKLEMCHREIPELDLYWVFSELQRIHKDAISLGPRGMLLVSQNFKYYNTYYMMHKQIMVDGERKTIPYRSGFIVPHVKAAFVASVSASEHYGIAIYAKEKDLNKAIDWFDSFVKENSIFKGRVLLVKDSGLEVNTPKPKETIDWDCIVPNDKAHKEFGMLVDMLTNSEKFKKAGLPVKRGVLLAGPPGTGKTVHVQCLINDVLSNKRSVIVLEGFPEDGWSLEAIYEQAMYIGPSLVVIEDIDTITHNRDDDGSLLPVSFLQELLGVLDGTKKLNGVVTVATSNFKERLDRALASRPGRFDVVYDFDFPEQEVKEKILEKHINQLKLKLSMDELLAIPEVEDLMESPYLSGAHIAELCFGIRRGKIHNPKGDLEEIAKNVAEQLSTVLMADIAKRESVTGFSV